MGPLYRQAPSEARRASAARAKPRRLLGREDEPREASSSRTLERSRQRGVASVEYLVAVIFVGLAVALTLAALAPRLVGEYGQRRERLYAPGP